MNKEQDKNLSPRLNVIAEQVVQQLKDNKKAGELPSDKEELSAFITELVSEAVQEALDDIINDVDNEVCSQMRGEFQ